MSVSKPLPSGRQALLQAALVVSLLLTPAQIGKRSQGSSSENGSLGRWPPTLFAAAQPTSGAGHDDCKTILKWLVASIQLKLDHEGTPHPESALRIALRVHGRTKPAIAHELTS